MKRNKQMKKKLIMLVSICALVLITILSLTACNKYKWNKIDGGDASAASISNGGYVVEQGNYVYFINGYVGDVTENNWGNAFKQSIMRCEKKQDGTYDNSTATVVVPKSIYYNSTKAGFAIFGNFIYYATPNVDKDSSGTASTTHTDFMRTSLDGQVTQLITTRNSRSTEFIFTPTRILFYESNTISYVDFSGMKTDKNISDGKGATSGTLAERVATYFWGYDAEYKVGQGASIADYVFFTQTLTNSYEHYNELKCIRYDGTGETTLATFSTYLTDAEIAAGYTNYPEKVFTFAISTAKIDSDDQITLVYKKSITLGSDATATVVGMFTNKVTLAGGFVVANEKNISTTDISEIYTLGYDNGVLAVVDSKIKYINTAATPVETELVVGKSATFRTALTLNNSVYVYYTDADNNAIYRVCINPKDNENKIFAEKMHTESYVFDFVGTKLFFIAEDDYDYIHVVDIAAYNGDILESTFVGKRTTEDQAAYDKAHEENA